jgi:hypothetical protein
MMVNKISSLFHLLQQKNTRLVRPAVQCIGLSLSFFCSLMLLFITAPSVAATFVVNSGYDVTDLNPGNGLCVAYIIVNPPFVLPFCTLRAAIEETNALPGEDTIILGYGTYRLSVEGVAEDQALTGDLDITDSVQVVGAGTAMSFIDADGLDRVFDIHGQDTTVTLSGVTIRNGRLPAGLISSQQGGGGIRNRGLLSLTVSAVSDNKVSGSGIDDTGGGILNQGQCQLINSTISGNHAVQGGGIMNDSGGSLKITACSIYSNSGQTGAGVMNQGTAEMTNSTLSSNNALRGTASGGAVYNRERLDLTHCTIADNAAILGGGLVNEGHSLSLINTLIANNSGGNCSLFSPILSEGYNLDSDNTCGLTSSDLNNIDPQLGLFQNNGGYTKSYGLNPGSPAIDAGKILPDVCIDQRGLTRPQRKGVDIGAVEANELSVAPMIMPVLL